MRPRTVVSLEQALSMTYATLRFAQLGWRVIRLESTPLAAGLPPGDPNRYIGTQVAGEDRHSYFVAPNVGKQAIALNLKDPEGRAVLHRLMEALEVDVFCCNTLPSRYRGFGIDFETLTAIRPRLVWAAISALGPRHPDTPGYDPAIQAMCGFMETTGLGDGPPTLAGIPVIDLKAGDEVYANVLLALAEQAEGAGARRIDVSMLQAAASWLITTLPLLDFDAGPEEYTRWGNAHRKFIPTNAYPTRDGYLYVAIGSNMQWQRLTATPMFAALASEARRTNAGRYAEREALYREIGAITGRLPTAEVEAVLAAAKIPNARIHTVPEVRALPDIAAHLTRTRTPAGKTIRMQPMAVEREEAIADLAFAPRYGEHTDAVLAEAGYAEPERARLREAGVIA